MKELDSTLPPQCRNCRFLRGRSDDFTAEATDYVRAAQAVMARSTQQTAEGSAADTDPILQQYQTDIALSMLLKGLRQKYGVDFISEELFCIGTDDPASPQLQPCNYLKSTSE